MSSFFYNCKKIGLQYVKKMLQILLQLRKILKKLVQVLGFFLHKLCKFLYNSIYFDKSMQIFVQDLQFL